MKKKTSETLLAEIDATLDQLIQNAEVLSGVRFDVLEHGEIEGLQKTQESLCARLLHRKELLDAKEHAHDNFEEKVARFTHLHLKFAREVAQQFKPKKPLRLRKSRLVKKSSFHLRQSPK
jgi:hypothetical protein